MIKINGILLDKISRQAKSSSRSRMNHNFHQSADDRMHRMLNAIEPGSYIQPHKHENPAKREAFFVLRGKIAVVEFNDEGEIIDHIILDEHNENHGTEVAVGTWHMIISLEKGSVAYEIKDGPWDPETDKEFAKWAPPEGHSSAAAYLEHIIRKLH